MKFRFISFIKQLYSLGKVIDRSNFGAIDNTSIIYAPLKISNPKNLFIFDHVSIDGGAILYATNAKIIIKKYFVSAVGLKISTGHHERRVGRFLGSITESEKNHSLDLDKDVIINEDVWAGFNVTILAGVEIGRGATLAAGAVITKSIPPYCIAAGCPAKFIRFYWTIDEIMLHESSLYSENDRLSREYLEDLFKHYNRDE